jgi:(R,R)-butanediol dehydrogenase/meso-butanediol dehydrogenase/diacetyl reductase
MCDRYWTVGLHAHGGLAEQVVVPASCTLNLSGSSLTPDLAALTQPMSIAVHATRRGRVAAGETVTVLGTGGIGTFITYAAAQAGAVVTAVDLDPAKLRVAARLGASATIDASREEVQALPRTDVVFECTARPESPALALGRVAENGRLVVVGHQPHPVTMDLKLVSMGEREVIGTMAHVFAADFPTAAAMIAADLGAWVELAPIVLPLGQVVESGLIPMAEGRAPQIKMLFDPTLDEPRPLRIST